MYVRTKNEASRSWLSKDRRQDVHVTEMCYHAATVYVIYCDAAFADGNNLMIHFAASSRKTSEGV